MVYPEGLYFQVKGNGELHRYVFENGKKTTLATTTIKEEIIEFSELNFIYYALVVDRLKELSKLVSIDNIDFEIPDKYFTEMLSFTYLLTEVLAENDPVSSVLLRLEIDDSLLSFHSHTPDMVRGRNCIVDYVEEIMKIQPFVNNILKDLSDGNEIDYENKYKFFCNFSLPTVWMVENNKFERYFYCKTLLQYYYFMTMYFIEEKYRVSSCKYCGKFFIPKTKKKTLYCDRVLKNGLTCKQQAPRVKHRLLAEQDEVVKAFDTIKNKLYKRLERTEISKDKTEKSLTYTEYYEWLNHAQVAKENYLSGKITKEDALTLIYVD